MSFCFIVCEQVLGLHAGLQIVKNSKQILHKGITLTTIDSKKLEKNSRSCRLPKNYLQLLL